MEFNEKLQTLRKSKGLTQDELAKALYVSRTAVSKWEQGKGYPNIDSLKQLSVLFGVSIDRLLSADELLTVAETDNRQRERKIHNTVFSLLDTSTLLFLFLPFFADRSGGSVQAVSLLSLTAAAPYLKPAFCAVTAATALCGIAGLLLHSCHGTLRQNEKNKLSLAVNTLAVIVFIVTNQPYAAVFIFSFLIIKASMLIKLQ